MSREGAPIMRCPNSVQRGAQLVARELASALVSFGQDPKDHLPFLRRGIETAEEIASIVVPKGCITEVTRAVLPTAELGPEANYQYIRK